MRGITADVLRKETIENQRTVIKNVQESQATAKGDGSNTDKNADSEDKSDLEQSDPEVSDSENDEDDKVFADLDIEEQEAQENLIVTTRYGRTAGGWKLAFT